MDKSSVTVHSLLVRVNVKAESLLYLLDKFYGVDTVAVDASAGGNSGGGEKLAEVAIAAGKILLNLLSALVTLQNCLKKASVEDYRAAVSACARVQLAALLLAPVLGLSSFFVSVSAFPCFLAVVH